MNHLRVTFQFQSDRREARNTWIDEPTRCNKKCANGDEGKIDTISGECYCYTEDCNTDFDPSKRGKEPCRMAVRPRNDFSSNQKCYCKA